ncbi:MAG: VWA domain-containing protein [Caldilineaceae bacterium]|nr:VWA domain-containing protein [Caldilineaceae bacterium]
MSRQTRSAADETTVNGNLLHQCVLFGRLLRAVGIPVTPAQIVDLAHSLSLFDIARKEDFRLCARAILVKRKEHLAPFEAAFELFWQRRLDSKPLQVHENGPTQNGSARATYGGAETTDAAAAQGTHRALTYSHMEILRRKDFAQLSDRELAQIRRMMAALAWQPQPRRTRRLVKAQKGRRLDLRRTLRQNLRHGGDLLRLAYRERKRRRRSLIVLCDISGSMERYSRVLLQFLYVITRRLDRVETFVFSTRLTRISRLLRRYSVDAALDRVQAAATDWGGGTRIGGAVHTFNRQWLRRLPTQQAVILMVSDGWDRGDVDLLAVEMEQLHRNSYRLIWLNPLLGAPDYRPLVRGIQAALPHVDDFLPVHNLTSLEQLARVLEEV